jgi:hypothetical protein
VFFSDFKSFLSSIKGGLKKRGSKATIAVVGTFKKVCRKTRKGRNPQTGEQIKNKGRSAIFYCDRRDTASRNSVFKTNSSVGSMRELFCNFLYPVFICQKDI